MTTPDERPDALVVTYRTADGRSDLIEEARTRGGDRREVGREVVETVAAEGATVGAAVLRERP